MKMISLLVLLSVVSVCMASLASAIQPRTVSVVLQEPNSSILADTYVQSSASSGNPNANFGLSNSLVLDVPASNTVRASSFIMFNLIRISQNGTIVFNDSSILNNGTLLNAQLRLRTYAGSNSMNVYAHHVFNHTWNETNMTFNTNACGSIAEQIWLGPYCNNTAESTHRTTGGDYVFSLNLTNMVRSELTNKENNVSVILSLDSGADNPGQTVAFYSKESGQLPENVTILNLLNITYALFNKVPNVSNISITTIPVSQGDSLTGHYLYNDSDNDNTTGNFTYWYVNQTLVTTANNTRTLLAGNVTTNANITFSARFNDTYDAGLWVNSTTLTVGDIVDPFVFAISSASTVVQGSTITLIGNISDNAQVASAKAEITSPTGSKVANLSMTLDSGAVAYGGWTVGYTPNEIGTYSFIVYAFDGNGNEYVYGTPSNFQSTAQPQSGSSSGGGGGSTTIVQGGNLTSLLSFGLTTLNFIVLSTPSESKKTIRFTNRGNTEFANGKLEVLGDAKTYINAQICKEPTSLCSTTGYSIKSGESAFLFVTGTFDSTLESGSQGIIRLSETKTDGKVSDLIVSIDRPLGYNFLIKPISNMDFYKSAFGNSEFPALVLGYSLFLLGIVMVVFVLRTL